MPLAIMAGKAPLAERNKPEDLLHLFFNNVRGFYIFKTHII